MRRQFIFDYGQYTIEKIDGNGWFVVLRGGVLVTVYKSLRGAKTYVSKRLNKNYHDLKNNPKVLFINHR
jgi:hypothetical protein